MGCEGSKSRDLLNEEFRAMTKGGGKLEFRSKYDSVVFKLKSLKNKATFARDKECINDIDW
jgi:hypothetical protein